MALAITVNQLSGKWRRLMPWHVPRMRGGNGQAWMRFANELTEALRLEMSYHEPLYASTDTEEQII
jgi:hypothetical protein